MPISLERAAALRTRRDALEAAETKLLTGAATASWAFDGETMSFQPADLPRLQRMIRDLNILLGDTDASALGFSF
ncbi:MAG: hypothetical protein WCF85_16405 [Rhodospirillaceae bacterium]